MTNQRPKEHEYASYVSYGRALEDYCNALEGQQAQPEQLLLAQEVIGCFHAAEVEGLTAALANTTDEHLKDLIERRLMYALYAAQETQEKQNECN
jgi:predicted negative regulator of RcsB-dependent stress response